MASGSRCGAPTEDSPRRRPSDRTFPRRNAAYGESPGWSGAEPWFTRPHDNPPQRGGRRRPIRIVTRHGVGAGCPRGIGLVLYSGSLTAGLRPGLSWAALLWRWAQAGDCLAGDFRTAVPMTLSNDQRDGITFMSRWRDEAFARFPELEDRFLLCEEAGSELSPHDVWEVLWEAFSEAHKAPRNDGMIRRVYEYCHWCVGQPVEEDLARHVVVCFFEMIPTLSEAVEDMPRWWSRADVVATREIFSYIVGEEGFARILARFDRPPDSPMS